MQQAKAIANQEKAMQQGETTGFASREAQNIARTDAIEALKLSALAEGMRGNIALAESQATQAINAKYAQIDKEIEDTKTNIYNNYDTMTPAEKKHHSHYHQLRGTAADSLYEGTNSMFASSGKCDHCHGFDPNGLASVDALGNDINVVDDWRTSMMANSAKDPYWRAKVSHEITINPGHQQEIESLCTRCHAPLGRFAAMAAGADHYSIAEMVEDSVALDGVSCLA